MISTVSPGVSAQERTSVAAIVGNLSLDLTSPAHVVELRRVRHSAEMSQETPCFSASIYIDGQDVGMVRNAGTGGADEIVPAKLRDTLELIAASLPEIDCSEFYQDGRVHTMSQSAETMIGGLLDAYLHREELKRLCKTQTLFRVPGQSYLDGEYLALSVRFLPEVKRHLIAEYGDKVEILNESL